MCYNIIWIQNLFYLELRDKNLIHKAVIKSFLQQLITLFSKK